ncbi:unnamed protein product [Lepeophtheirus salmonis]|uniref:(salmon louse) hypothetical protein n=1 Tax=Lepeophtheirus salmonis TaxID=72036 RepID=A0A7R8CAV3_LEPSM|nr:unnamed protein product [Lepeophtheirus salmonis]CAF2750396.1 unnamed protein product [Lepeophtheirus salmonis]
MTRRTTDRVMSSSPKETFNSRSQLEIMCVFLRFIEKSEISLKLFIVSNEALIDCTISSSDPIASEGSLGHVAWSEVDLHALNNLGSSSLTESGPPPDLEIDDVSLGPF